MTRTVLCFGDSNTHGTMPMETLTSSRRHAPEDRWPRAAEAALGAGWQVIEEGLPGRTAQFPDPVMGDHMDGRMGLRIALASHRPVDVLAIMLGTNDTKAMFGADARRVAAGLAGLLAMANDVMVQEAHGGFRVLLICPPPVLEQGPIARQFAGARETSLALPPLLRDLAATWGAGFLDAGSVIEVSPVDGVHFDAEAQRSLGRAVAGAIEAL
ncbi:SGNH/GDSL hydrolase family protein [Pseudoroseicyclus aestuarii]|uniref:Lysophospholipase L1-like esterase n=1 Tax=Pseudoroseicyclus aestuarii TaxID=1795041 RepID=A0A318SX04_9RHOB|nr:SGNH/GDSL hydrolase family protein [Pseudoroseicyclus aestuarii]PYE84926.1 lysophospholipase L1-like esterase [Pseudoroseicyclus aestuarii]